MTIVLPISPVLLHVGPKFKYLYLMFSMSRNILAMSEFTSGGRHIGFQDGRHTFYTLLCISLPVALWKENKDSLHLGKCLLCGNCHHIAAISEFKMAATVLF